MSLSPAPSPPLAAVISPISDDTKNGRSSSNPEHPPPETRTPGFPTREDCWSEDASRTLIDAWGDHYLELNRGNLRREHWQEIADTVNDLHGSSFKFRRTDVQCKNRIDTIKNKYKIEKSKAVQSGGRYSTWPHFRSMDSLIGDAFSKSNNNNSNGPSGNPIRRGSISPDVSSSPPPPSGPLVPHRKSSPAMFRDEDKYPASNQLPKVPWPVPVGPRSKRSATERNFSVMAAAAAAMEAKEDDELDDEDSEPWITKMPAMGMKRKGSMVEKVEGFKRLAEAIAMLGKIYEKVEEAKQRQMVELEKQRMQFAKDLEIQRMKVFMESQVQLEKLKRVKRNSQSNGYL